MVPICSYYLNARKRALNSNYALDARFYFTTCYIEPASEKPAEVEKPGKNETTQD